MDTVFEIIAELSCWAIFILVPSQQSVGEIERQLRNAAAASSSEEVLLNWNKWIRQIHRWLSMAFTVAVIVNIVAIALKKYTASLGLLAVFPLALLLFTGLYLFVLPYVTKWRSSRSVESKW